MVKRWATLAILALLIPAVSAEPTELEIVSEFLAEFDYGMNPGGQRVSLVQDPCHRQGGAEYFGDAPRPPGGGNNALLIQHVEWHSDRGGFFSPVYTSADSDPYGQEFLEFHQLLIATYDEWRANNNYSVLIAWDPSTPIPDEFAYDVQPPCVPRSNEDPGIELPSFLTKEGGDEPSPFWGYTDLCSIRDVNRLGKIIEESDYHDAVHEAVGGDMMLVSFTLRDPIFWAWHNYVEGIHQNWYSCASVQPVQEVGEEANGLAFVGLVAALLLAMRRKP